MAGRVAFRGKKPAVIPEVYPQGVVAGHQQDDVAAYLLLGFMQSVWCQGREKDSLISKIFKRYKDTSAQKIQSGQSLCGILR